VEETAGTRAHRPARRTPPIGEEPGALVFTALVSISLMGPLALHIFLPALPYVRQAFSVDANTAQLAFSLAMLSMAAATLFYGSLSDRFGRLPMLLWGIGLFAAGALIATLAPSIAVLILGRVVQGMGAACGMVMARAIARDVYGEKRLGQVIAYLTAAYVVGPMFAPALGGLLTDAFGWQAILVVPALFGVLSMFASVAVLGETKPRPGKPPSGLIRGYLQLLRIPQFGLFAVSPAFATGGFLALNAGATYLIIEVLGRPATEFGLYFMLGPAGYVTGNFLSGRLIGRVSGNTLIIWGCIIAFLGALTLIGLIGGFGLAPLCFFIPSAVMSLGQGLFMPHAQAFAIATEPSLTGTASGIVVFLKFFIGGIATQLVVLSPESLATLLIVVVTVANLAALVCGVAAVSMSRRVTSWTM
jgi:DHA1 family bicyclomycin/chloramphenicol resistance-like MFS transporter